MPTMSRAFVFEPGAAGANEREWQGTLYGPAGRVTELRLRLVGDSLTLPPVLDGLVGAMLPVVMRAGGVLHVRGSMTRGALRNLTEFSEAWADWRSSHFHRVTIEADRVVDGPALPASDEAILAWSGSLRSTHTLVRHLDGLVPGHFKVRAALRVLGLRGTDDDVDDAVALEGARLALAPDGVDLRAVRTNAAAARLIDPEIGVLPVVGAALHAVSARCIVSLHARSWLFAAHLRFPRPGPVLQDLYSGDRFAVRADGGVTSPPEMAEAVSRHPALAAAISDCERGPRHAPPCGRCADCTLTALAFLAAGHSPPRPQLRARLAGVAMLPFRDPVRAADAEATLAGWRRGGHPALRGILAARAAVARAVTNVRDHGRWLGAMAGLRPPWPR